MFSMLCIVSVPCNNMKACLNVLERRVQHIDTQRAIRKQQTQNEGLHVLDFEHRSR